MEYELTPLGLSLRSPIDAITGWAEQHLSEILGARESAENITLTSPVDAGARLK